MLTKTNREAHPYSVNRDGSVAQYGLANTGRCIDCKKKFEWGANIRTLAGIQDSFLVSTCEDCFNESLVPL